jgi:serine protease Do
VIAASVCCGDNQSQLVQAAVLKVSPNVVRIRTIGDPGSDDLTVSSQITTGVVISNDGEILTSSFGFSGQPAAVFVEDSDGQRVSAKVVATDHVRKLVLLKCTSGTFQSTLPSDGRWPAVGATAIALGKFYPVATPSVSVGIVSAIHRIHELAIQTDAKISPVNYGGPLIDLDGQVMGVLVPLSPQDTDGISAGVEWYDSGIGFCIPLQDALNTAAMLRTGKDRVRGRLGISLSTRNPLAGDFEVTTVHPESPAATAGLKKGDTIVEANGVAIERFGHLDAVVKSSYAGDSLRLVVKRDADTFDVELQLVERLETPNRGYLGIIPIEVVRDKDDKPEGVLIRVLPGSPADVAGITDSTEIVKWGDDAITSTAMLDKALRLTFAGMEKQVELRKVGQATTNTVQVTAGEMPDTIQSISDDLLQSVTQAVEASEWTRSEETLSDDLGKVWLYAPKVSPELKTGFIILLSDTDAPTETVLKKWGAVCQRHNLVLVVPSAGGETQLTREHVSVVQAALTTAFKGRGVDTKRIVLVAQKTQAGLCGDLLFNSRTLSLSAAVFVDCWPRVAGVSQELVARKSISALIQTGKMRSRQAVALQAQALALLKKSGVQMIQSNPDDASFESPEEEIAAWTFQLKVR